MKQFSSTQEYVIHNLSQRLLGNQALFCPDNYKGSREPADVAWVANRCAILMYMTESKGSYEKKKSHNLRQLNRWLRDWQGGQTLAGTVGARQYQFSFDDVDHVIGLSIIDGGETWCEYHPERVSVRLDRKVSACATVTGGVIRELATIGAGPRDLLAWLNAINQVNRRLSEEELLASIRNWIASEKLKLQSEFQDIQKDVDFREHAVRETVAIVAWSKTPQGAVLSEIGADLTWEQIAWLGYANAALESQIAPPGQTGHLVMKAVYDTGIYNLECEVAAGVKFVKDREIEPTTRPTLHISTMLDFGRNMPARAVFIKDRTDQPSHLQLELAAIRQETLDQSSNPNTE